MGFRKIKLFYAIGVLSCAVHFTIGLVQTPATIYGAHVSLRFASHDSYVSSDSIYWSFHADSGGPRHAIKARLTFSITMSSKDHEVFVNSKLAIPDIVSQNWETKGMKAKLALTKFLMD